MKYKKAYENYVEQFGLGRKKHTVVPIIIWNKNEYEGLPNFGIITINDSESGEESTIFLRKKLKNDLI